MGSSASGCTFLDDEMVSLTTLQSTAKISVPSLDLPSLTVYESVDLGITTTLRETSPSLVSLMKDNYCHFHVDPLYTGRVYVSHSFGVHVIDMRSWMRAISHALADENDTQLVEALKNAGGSEVSHLLNTFSAEQKYGERKLSIRTPDRSYHCFISLPGVAHLSLP